MRKINIKSLILFILTTCIISNIISTTNAKTSERLEKLMPYIKRYPHSVFFCALTPYKPIINEAEGTKAGHGLMYLQGAKLDYHYFPPRLRPIHTAELKKKPYQGVGISVNRNLKNVSWLSIPDPDFFFFGGIAEDEVLDLQKRETIIEKLKPYLKNLRTDLKAASRKEELDELAKSMVGTDVAFMLARNSICQNIPMTPELFELFLSVLNGISDSQTPEYNFSILANNCSFPINNAIALVTGSLQYKDTNQAFPFSLFDIVIPPDTLYRLHKRFHLKVSTDPDHYYYNFMYRNVFLKYGWTILEHGTFTQYIPIHRAEKNLLFRSPENVLSFPEYHFPLSFTDRLEVLKAGTKDENYQYSYKHYKAYQRFYAKVSHNIEVAKKGPHYKSSKDYRLFIDKFDNYIKDKIEEAYY